MTSAIKMTLTDPGAVIGVRAIDIVLDGNIVGSTAFGSKETITCAAGPHTVQLILHGIFSRRSNPIRVELAEAEEASLVAKYSRLWGNMKLSKA